MTKVSMNDWSERKDILIKLLRRLDEFANQSLSPREHESYEVTKKTLIERNSQHEK